MKDEYDFGSPVRYWEDELPFRGFIVKTPVHGVADITVVREAWGPGQGAASLLWLRDVPYCGAVANGCGGTSAPCWNATSENDRDFYPPSSKDEAVRFSLRSVVIEAVEDGRLPWPDNRYECDLCSEARRDVLVFFRDEDDTWRYCADCLARVRAEIDRVLGAMKRVGA